MNQYVVEFLPLNGLEGIFSHSPNTPRVLIINSQASERRRLSILLHLTYLHNLYPFDFPAFMLPLQVPDEAMEKERELSPELTVIGRAVS